jgi:hypothetical protein
MGPGITATQNQLSFLGVVRHFLVMLTQPHRFLLELVYRVQHQDGAIPVSA